MSEWRDQEVRNESRSRDRNEWIAETRGSLALDHPVTEVYVCECSDPACGARISLTRIEYEDVRGYPTHFAIATDHENPEVDQLVSEERRFTVVAKIAGDPARIARLASLGSPPLSAGVRQPLKQRSITGGTRCSRESYRKASTTSIEAANSHSGYSGSSS